MSLNIKFWGVRGSIPASPSPVELQLHIDNMIGWYLSQQGKLQIKNSRFTESLPTPTVGGYGTATTCVQVISPKSKIIIDGGSGIRHLSEKIVTAKSYTERGPFHILMTHFHWDHIIGLPFFTPHFIPGTTIHYYAVQSELEEVVRSVFKRPYFPVPFEKLAANVHFHILEPRKTFEIGDLKITPYKLDHPDPCWGYKVQSQGKTYSHCVDTEGTRVSQEELGEDLPLYQNVDLMYFDAQYTLPQLAEKANWGHSASQVGLDIAMREKIKKVVFAHHDPGANISGVEDLRRQTDEYYQWRIQSMKNNKEIVNEVDWQFAYEGLEIKL